MNEFDQFVKHGLKAKRYIRYADDFVIFSQDRQWLINKIGQINNFLDVKLRLTMHPDKLFVSTLASAVDFLGWVHFSNHRVLRTTTKHRMMRRIQERGRKETLQLYLGLLKHGDTFKLRQETLNQYWLWRN